MRIVELFPCSGGMAEGARRAGLAISMSFDWSADACDSYEANHGHRPAQIDVLDLLRMAREGWRPPPIDLLIADPPCTPWSRAGKRLGTEDERDMLEPTVELVRILRPRTYLIANVPGLDDSPNWPVVQRLIGGLAKDGYCVVDFARLDAADYGVPQHRVRPFWFGHLDGPCVQWPARTHGAAHELGALPGIDSLLPYVTCRAALHHLSTEDLGRPIKLRWRGQNGRQVASVPDRPARVVGVSTLSDGNVLYDGPNHRPSSADAPARTLTTNDYSDGALLVVPHHPVSPDKDGLSRTIRASSGGTPDKIMQWPWERPATTITTRDVVPPPPDTTRKRARSSRSLARSSCPKRPPQSFRASPRRGCSAARRKRRDGTRSEWRCRPVSLSPCSARFASAGRARHDRPTRPAAPRPA